MARPKTFGAQIALKVKDDKTERERFKLEAQRFINAASISVKISKLEPTKKSLTDFADNVKNELDAKTISMQVKNLTVLKETVTSLRKAIQTRMDSDETGITIKKIKFGKGALTKLQKEASKAVGTLDLEKLGKLIEKINIKTDTKGPEELGQSLEEAREKAAKVNGAFEMLLSTSKSLKRIFESTNSAMPNLSQDDTEFKQLGKEYRDYLVQLNKLKEAVKQPETVDVADLDTLISSGGALADRIQTLKEERKISTDTVKKETALRRALEDAIDDCTYEMDGFRQKYESMLSELSDENVSLDTIKRISKEFNSLNSKSGLGAENYSNLSTAYSLLRNIESYTNKNALAAGRFADELDDARDILRSSIEDGFISTADLERVRTIIGKMKLEAVELDDALNLNVDTSKIIRKLREMEVYLTNNTRAARVFENEFKGMRSTLKNGLDHGLSVANFKELSNDYDSLRTKIREFGLEGKTAGETIRGAISKFTSWSTVTTAIGYATTAIRDMLTAVKELDYSLGSLKIITSETAETYSHFITDVSTAAQSVGSSMTEIMNSSITWARLGYSLQDSLDMSAITAQYSTVAGTDIEAATSAMVSALQAFNQEGGDSVELARRIADEFALVGNRFPIDAEGIGEGLKRAAAALVSANNSLEESIALVTAGDLITQDADATGTTLKTISARIRGARAELEELEGEAVDVEAIKVKLYRDIKAIADVDIMQDANTFKSTYQIMKEIAEVWDTIPDLKQAVLIEDLAGKRNISAVSSILENFDIAEEVLDSAMGATGTVAKANEEYLDTITGKLEQLSAAFENFSDVAFESESLKTIIDLAREFLNVMTEIIDTTGALPPLIGLVAGGLTALGKTPLALFTANGKDGLGFGGAGLGSIIQEFQAIKEIQDAIDNDGDVSAVLKENSPRIRNQKDLDAIGALCDEYLEMRDAAAEAQAATNNLGNSVGAGAGAANASAKSQTMLTKALIKQKAAALGSAVAATALNAALSFGIALVATLAVQGIVSMVQSLSDANREATDLAYAAEKANEQLASTQDDIKGLQEDIKVNAEEILELETSGVDGAVEKAKALRLQNERYEAQLELLEKRVELEAKDAERKTIAAATSATVEVNDYAGPRIEGAFFNNGYTSEQMGYNEALQSYMAQYESVSSEISSLEADLQKDLSRSQKQAIKARLSELNTSKDNILDGLETVYDEYSDVASQMEDFESPNATKFVEGFDEMTAALNSFYDAQMTAEFSSSDVAIANAESAIRNQQSVIAELNEIINDMNGGMKYNAEQIASLIAKYPELESAVKKVGESFVINTDSIDKLSVGVRFNKSEVEALKAAYPQLVDWVQTSTGEYYIEQDALEGVASTTLDLKVIAISAELEKTKQVATSTAARINLFKDEIEGIASLADAYAAYAKIQSYKQAWKRTGTEEARHQSSAYFTGVSAGESTGDPELNALESNVSTMIEQYENIANLSDQIRNLASSIGTGSSGSGAGSYSYPSSNTDTDKSSGSTDADAWAKTYLEEIEALKKQVDVLEVKNASVDDVIALQQLIQAKENALANMARARGYGEASEFIADRQLSWWQQYKEVVTKKTEVITDQIGLLSYQIDMLDETGANMRTAMELEAQIIEQNQKLKDMYTLYYNYTDDDSEIYELNKSIKESQKKLEDYLDKMVSYYTDSLDEIQDAYNTMKDAAEEFGKYGAISADTYQELLGLGSEYYKYLFSENGQLVINEQNIKAVTKARAEQVGVETAFAYVEKLRLAVNSGNAEQLGKLLGLTEALTGETWDLVYAQLGAISLTKDQYDAAIDQISKIRALTANMVTNVDTDLKDQAQAVTDLFDLVQDMIEQENENMIDALEEQKDAYSDLIDLKKELLEQTADEAEYEKEVADQVKTVAKLQAQIARLSLDDSREAAAERASLEEELGEALETLNKTQSDHALEVTEEMLDDMNDAYADEKDLEIEQLEKSLSSTEKLYQATMDRINNGWDDLYDDLKTYNYEYGDLTKTELEDVWDTALQAAERYGDYVSALNAVTSGEANGGYSIVGNDSTVGEKADATNTAVKSYLQRMKSNSDAWWATTDKDRRESLSKENDNLAKKVEYALNVKLYRDASGVWRIGSYDGPSLYEMYGVYHKGGVVGDNSNLKQNEVMAVLEKGELVLDKPKEETLFKSIDFIEELSARLGTVLDRANVESVFGRSFNAIRTIDPTAQTVINSPTNYIPNIEVNIDYNGSGSDSDARKLGETIADVAIDKIYSGFVKRGMSNFKGAALRP